MTNIPKVLPIEGEKCHPVRAPMTNIPKALPIEGEMSDRTEGVLRGFLRR